MKTIGVPGLVLLSWAAAATQAAAAPHCDREGGCGGRAAWDRVAAHAVAAFMRILPPQLANSGWN